MKRKMVFVGISFALGLFCASFYSMTIFLGFFVFGLCGAALFLLKRKYAELICCILCFILGFAYYILYDVAQFSPLRSYDNQKVLLCGKVVGISDSGNDSFTLTVKGKIENDDAKVLLYCSGTKAEIGDEIEAFGKVSAFEDSYLFDAKNYYNSNGIILSMYAPEYMYVYDGGFSLVNIINQYVNDVKDVIRRQLPDVEGELLCAMLFGDKSGIDNSGKTLFFRSGIGHIMATSGLHLVIIVSLVMFVISPLFGKHKIAKAIVAMVFGALFVVCASFSMSVIRAYIMLSFAFLAPIFFRKNDSLNSLCLTVVAMTVFSPYIISSPSFVLSVFGVITTSVFAPYLTKNIKNHILKSIAFAICVSLCIIPAGILYFDEVSLISPISNLVLIPLCTVALCCAALVFVFSKVAFLTEPLLMIAGFSCKLVDFGVDVLGNLSFAGIPVGNIGVKIYIWLSFVGIILYFLFLGKKAKRIFAILTPVAGLVVVTAVSILITKNSETISVYSDSGGTVAVIQDERGVTVIDSGAQSSADFTVKYLSSLGIYNINTLYLACDVESSVAKWEICAENFDINSVVDASYDLENENITIFEKDYYYLSTENLNLCITDRVLDDKSEFDCAYLIGDDADANCEYCVLQEDVKSFSLSYAFDRIKIDYIEKIEEE